ncbi:hypothetical protein BSLG_006578 [Batrachochytrium salamandrivorans]|nr:hypothetical protein BSLG_006578 [Batrachochytrium salamandrivorans]
MSNKDISKIAAAGERRAQTFAHLDDAKLGWFHMRATLVAGVGFFTDAYDIFVISQAVAMIEKICSASVTSVTRKLGRKQMYGIEAHHHDCVYHWFRIRIFYPQGVSVLSLLVVLSPLPLLPHSKLLFVPTSSTLTMFGVSCLASVLSALCAVYFRMTIPETPRYTVDVLGDEEAAERDVSKVPYEQFFQKAIGAVLINLMGTVPGYWVTVAAMKSLAVSLFSTLDSGVITVCLIILSLLDGNTCSPTPLSLLLYTPIAQFFFNFGPNSTTFIVPGEVFPYPLEVNWTRQAPQAVLYTFAVVMATGFAATYLVPETKGKTLELSNEDDVFVSA